jgi:hypothetical protein
MSKFGKTLTKLSNKIFSSVKKQSASNISKKVKQSIKISKEVEKCRSKKCPKVAKLHSQLTKCYKDELDEYKKHVDNIMFKLLQKYGISKSDVEKIRKIKNIPKRRKLAYKLVEDSKLDMKKIKKESQKELRKLPKYKSYGLGVFPEIEECHKKYNMTMEDLTSLMTHCQETFCSELDEKLKQASILGPDFIEKQRKRQRKQFNKIKSRKNIQNLLN